MLKYKILGKIYKCVQ